MLDIEKVRQNFPVLKRQVAGRPIVYLDSAATYLKPQAVIDAVCECYQQAAGTIGRAVHVMAEDATTRFEDARESIADFINADADEIVFTRMRPMRSIWLRPVCRREPRFLVRSVNITAIFYLGAIGTNSKSSHYPKTAE